jgi:hypothetical protein
VIVGSTNLSSTEMNMNTTPAIKFLNKGKYKNIIKKCVKDNKSKLTGNSGNEYA